MAPVKSKMARGGGIFAQMRIVPQIPASVPSTPDEHIALVFANCLKSGRGSGHDVYHSSGPLVDHVARRITESTALRDAAECLVLAWQNFRRGLPSSNLIDLASYGKALRSL